MEDKLRELSEIVEYVYETEPKGADMLCIEEQFEKLYQTILWQELKREQRFEFLCLEYEYKLHHVYRFMNFMPEVIQKTLKSLKEILLQADSHQRIKKLTERIFAVGFDAAEAQAAVLKRSRNKADQLAWVWEEYAEQYAHYKKYAESLKYYWWALDIYLNAAACEDWYIKRKLFYDGKSEMHISDIIYRMYRKAATPGHLWKECIHEFVKRESALDGYDYGKLYLAGAQYERALEMKNPHKMLEASLSTIRKLPQDNRTDGGYDIECGALYQLNRYKEVLDVCKKAKQIYTRPQELKESKRLAFFSALNLLIISGIRKKHKEFKIMLAEAATYFQEVHVSVLDGAKIYIPIFDFYISNKEEPDVDTLLMELFFELTTAVSILMGSLKFENESIDLGYYTSLTSLYYVLSDECEDVKYRLSLFDARHMNDPNEGKVLAEYLGRKKRGKCGERNRWSYDNTITFLKSFTTNVDSLPMWVQYADGGKGCFVRIDPTMFRKGQLLVETRKNEFVNNLHKEESYILYNVAYFDGEKFTTSTGKDVTSCVEKIRDIYMRLMQLTEKYDDQLQMEVERVIDHILSHVQYLIKKDDYRTEEEVRIFFQRSGDEEDIKRTGVQESGIPRIYINLKVPTEIKEIIFGPKAGNGYDIVPYIYLQLQKMGGEKDVKVTQSVIEYV